MPRILRSLASLPVLFLTLAASGEGILRTTTELRSLSEDEIRRGLRFELTAQVLHKTPGITGCAFVVRDESGGLYMKAENNPDSFTYEPGDVIHCTGATMIDRDRQIGIMCDRTEKVGTRPLPPVISANPAHIPRGDYNYSRIRLSGTVTDAFRDEIDPENEYIVIRTGPHTIYAAIQDSPTVRMDHSDLIDAEVALTGICMPAQNGRRIFLGPRIQMDQLSEIKVLKRPPSDPFAVPVLDDIHHIGASSIVQMGRRRIGGWVSAAWRARNLMLRTDRGDHLRVDLRDGPLPPCGSHIEVAGSPGTDLFHLTLTRAIWRSAPIERTAPEHPKRIAVGDLLFDKRGERKFRPERQGQLLELTGIVRSLPPPDDPAARMMLDCDDNLVPVDASSTPSSFAGLTPGCKVSVTGVCVIDIRNWSPSTVFPRIEGLMLVVRSPDDVRVISRPPWWTPGRLLVVIGSLLAALLGILIWNRILNRLVERRSRELLREQAGRVGDRLKIGERTRLAVELHDSLSQTLTGVSFQIDAAEQARQKDHSQIKKYLDVARRTLQSCREELRNCLWDLRNNALEEADAEVAIRKTVEPHVGEADVAIDFKVPRAKLTDNTFHSILCIVRELAANAVRHGHARHVTVRGEIDDGRLTLFVTDDGRGFDPNRRPGAEEGHFGLLGVAERIEALGGTLDIQSAPERGTSVSVTIPTGS